MFGKKQNPESHENPESVTIRVTCSHCRRQCDFKSPEITIRTWKSAALDYGVDDTYEFTCLYSECQEFNQISASEVIIKMLRDANVREIKMAPPDETDDSIRYDDGTLSLDLAIELGLNDDIIKTLLREDPSKCVLIGGNALRWALEQIRLNDNEASH